MTDNPFLSIMTERYAKNVLDHKKAGTKLCRRASLWDREAWSPGMIMLYPRESQRGVLTGTLRVAELEMLWPSELIQWIEANTDEDVWTALVEAAEQYLSKNKQYRETQCGGEGPAAVSRQTR